MNQAKHGISFTEAQALWMDPHRMEIKARSLTEERFQVIGRIGNTLWSAFITYRHEKVRIFSVRRARANEARRYAHQFSEGDPDR